MWKRKKIAVAGAGYVGMAMGVLLAQNNPVSIVDPLPEKVNKINQKISPIVDQMLSEYLSRPSISPQATLDGDQAYREAAFVIVATPTNYDSEQNHFDTSSVESVIQQVQRVNPSAVIVIKSTVPVGFTEKMAERYPESKLLFCPEFLREGRALYDNLYPSRIIVGLPGRVPPSWRRQRYLQSFLFRGREKDTDVLYMDSTEAEAVKLFANTYLALRIAFSTSLIHTRRRGA